MIIGPFVAFLGTVLLIMLLRPIANAAGLVDVPNVRSSHSHATPLVGGLAIYIAVASAYFIPATMGLVPLNREAGSFFIAGLVVVSIGVIDDYRPLPSLFRFVAQIVASLIMIYGGGIVLMDLGGMVPSGEIVYMGWISVPFTVFATLGVINALNMCDGLDGLSGIMALISLSGLLLVAVFGGEVTATYILMLLATAIVGFLIFNLRIPGRIRAAVFMGDAGSMFLGLALTWFAISLSQGNDRVITPAAALWFLMLPIFDTVAMTIRRIRRRQSPFKPDKEHLHHVFLLAGFTVNETVIIMAAAAMIGVGIGFLSLDMHAPEFSVAGLFLVAGLLYMWMVMRSWKFMRFIERSICRRRGDRRSGDDRRQNCDAAYSGEERRSGKDRRAGEQRATVDGVAPIEVDVPCQRES
jgi:UDP-GlcNAc:undecaprenyl-phosphate/decaprenyl-phosphate GlcNAc-1-phosphate transferase